MSVGRPVVATRAGGVPEFVAHDVDGLLVTPGEPEELSVALEALLGDRARLMRLEAGARTKAEFFRIERHVEEMKALWRAVLDGGPAPMGGRPPGRDASASGGSDAAEGRA